MTGAKAISKYLSRHAEPESAAAERLAGPFGHVLVVPSYGEGEGLFDTLGSAPRGPRGETLIVVVLNARVDSSTAVHEANEAARSRLLERASGAEGMAAEHPVSSLSYPNGRIVLVDRASPGHYLPAGQGVGLARKIGCDLALCLHDRGRIASPWIHNTDADTRLPNDYFDQTESIDASGSAAAIYSFEHRFHEEGLGEAGRLHEISLRYYTLGLAWAGSPYAYEAMGSCVAVPPAAYAEVRGFPRKNAAEDFYLLNKLAKVGRIVRLAGAPLHLDGRISDRVPFGTGKAISRLASSRRARTGFCLYHPAVFAHLAAWLRALAAVAHSGGKLEAALEELPRGNPFFRTDLLLESLERMGAFAAVREAIGRSTEPASMLRHFHTWFDAFRTLKLVHALRDGGLSSLGFREALAEAPFTGLSASTEEEPEALRRALAVEERALGVRPAGVPAVGDV